MQEDKSKLFGFAMQGGIFLGLFWILKYFFVVVAEGHSIAQFLIPVLSALTPVILLQYLIKYRITVLDGTISFWHGVQFAIMLFFFASLFEAVAAFIHITWIDQAFVGKMYQQMVEALRSFNISESMVSNFENQPIPSAFGYLINNVILSDVFIGIVLSLFIVPISRIINPKNITKEQFDADE